MNIQIFGKSKCFDTKKAERWFKERRVKFQAVDLKKQGMSLGELTSVKNAVGLEAMVDPRHPDAALVSYLASDQAKLEKLFEDPSLLRTPVVRNGRQATVGFCPCLKSPFYGTTYLLCWGVKPGKEDTDYVKKRQSKDKTALSLPPAPAADRRGPPPHRAPDY